MTDRQLKLLHLLDYALTHQHSRFWIPTLTRLLTQEEVTRGE
jgi:hypothetical protein